MASDRPRTSISAWRPPVPGIAEAFHAHFTNHAYPAHTHDAWDLMILDDGSLSFVRMLGAGLTLTILLDTFLIRLVLVPSVMRLAGSVNRWAPAPLRRWHARHGFSD
ncbi:hypothetical protein ABZW18_32315 [Streptomyces sp. NPDC004647]|uniref:hypothetical protein n=1 Tax=Streptomyces sp. NPDC004647 TaxID=3154671 RepID=UPI0033AE3EBF